jgi:hypothetical protein
MNRTIRLCSILLLVVGSAAAEIKSIDISIFGMD